MITQKQIEQITELIGEKLLTQFVKNDVVISIVIGDYDFTQEKMLESAFGWDKEVIDFVRRTTPEERKQIATVVKIHALEKELEQLKSELK